MLLATSVSASFHWKNLNARLIAFATLPLGLWQLGSVLRDQFQDRYDKIWAMRFASATAIWFVYFFWLFCRNKFRKKEADFKAWASAGIFTALSGLMLTSYSLNDFRLVNGSAQPYSPGPVYHLMALVCMVYFSASAWRLFRFVTTKKLTPLEVVAAKKIVISMGLIMTGVFLTSYVFVLLNFSSAWADIMSSLSVVTFSLILWSTIIDDGLLPFRGYLLETISLLLLMVGATVLVKTILEPFNNPSLLPYLAPAMSVLVFFLAEDRLKGYLREKLDKSYYDDADVVNKLVRNLLTASSHDYVTKVCLESASKALKTNVHIEGRRIIALPRKSGHHFNAKDKRLLDTISRIHKDSLETQDKNAEIKRFNSRLKQDVSDATDKLRSANKKLQESAQLKSDFIAMASHQMKPQIVAATGFFELLKSEPDLRSLGLETMRRINRLTEDFMSLTKIESNQITPRLEQVNLSDVARESLKKYQYLIDKKSLKLAAKFDDSTTTCDPNLTLEILDNLLDNAINYTPRGGSISIKVGQEIGNTFCSISDTGIGVPASEQKKLFSRFSRLTNAREYQAKGSGIGLYVARNLAREMGGDVAYSPNSPAGSVFTLNF
jgi:signal transduction histidine kinase